MAYQSANYKKWLSIVWAKRAILPVGNQVLADLPKDRAIAFKTESYFFIFSEVRECFLTKNGTLFCWQGREVLEKLARRDRESEPNTDRPSAA